jgi:hypothetical protein
MSNIVGVIVAALVLTGDKTVDVYFTETPPEGEGSLWVCAYDGDAIMRCGTVDQFVDHMESREKAPSPKVVPPRPSTQEL